MTKLQLEDLKISNPMLMKLICNNKVVIHIAHNHARTKLVDVDQKFFNEKLEGLICMSYAPTQEFPHVLMEGLQKGQIL